MSNVSHIMRYGIALLTLLIFSSNIWGENRFYFETHTTTVPTRHGIQFGDLNGDGISDVVSGNIGGLPGRKTFAVNIYFGNQDNFTNAYFFSAGINEPGPYYYVGDWIKGGALEIFGKIDYYGYKTNSFVDGVHESIYSYTIPPPVYLPDQTTIGDFDADTYQDIYQTNFFQVFSSILFGDGKGIFTKIDLIENFPLFPKTIDWNLDHCTDLIESATTGFTIYYGNPNRENIFSVTNYKELSIPITRIDPLEYDDGRKPDLLIQSGTEFFFITQNLQNEIQTIPITVSGSFNPNQYFLGDLDQDGEYDLITLQNQRLFIYRGDGTGAFTYAGDVLLKYVTEIINHHITDMDLDGNLDIILCPKDGPLLILLNRPWIENPIPIVTPTAIPYPTMLPTPTLTPIENIPGAIETDLESDVYDTINQASSGSTILVASGTYSPPWGETNKLEIKDKELTIIGKDPNDNVNLIGEFTFENSHILIQNIKIDPYHVFFSPLRLIDCDLTLINNKISETYNIKPQNYWEMYPPAEPVIYFGDASNKSITFIDNEIEKGDVASLAIINCTNCIVDMTENSHFGQPDFQAQINIESSQNIKIYLPAHSLQDITWDLSFLKITNSTVDIYDGLIHGTNGKSAIVAEDGSPAITASSNSTVLLHNTILIGGKGGDGIALGKDAEPFTVDDTSTIEWVTDIPSWCLY